MITIKLISWNVNGIRACIKKGFMDFFNEIDADILCIQETKCQVGQVEINTEGYYQYWNQAEKKGYSGTAIFTKTKPINISYGLDINKHDNEGRMITLEFDAFFLVNVYTPNSQRELARLDYRMDWENDFKIYISSLSKIKSTIVCGDLNVAHKEIDLKNPKTNRKNAGFTDEERQKMTNLLANGFVDSYRHFNPDTTGAYSWWSYMRNSRANNAGWRIDYFLVSQDIANKMNSVDILNQILGSDHCPVALEIF